MNPMFNNSKMLSTEEFEQKLRQQKDPMKISLTNPMVNFESNSMQVSPMSPNPMGMNPNMDYNQMKKQKEFFANSMANGLKGKSSNSSLNSSSNNLFRMNSDQTLMQSPRFGPLNPGMGGNMPNMELPMQNKYLNNSDLTIDTSFRPMDNSSYEFNPMMKMNSNYSASQSSFNSFGGFRDESFDDDDDFDDILEPKQRKQTETEALADFLKNTGPDMLGPPISPAGSIEGKKKRGSLFKFKKGKKKEKKPSTLSEEIGSGSNSPPSNGNTPKHTPIVINYPGAENQPNLNPNSNSSSQQNVMGNSSIPNQFVMNNNGPNPNVPPMPNGFNNLKSSGSVSSLNSLQGNGSPYIMSLKNRQEIPESPLHEGGPRFNNFQNSNLMQQQQLQMQAQNMSMAQKAQGENFPYSNKPGMIMTHNNGSNSDLSIQSPITGPQDPRIMNKMKNMNQQHNNPMSNSVSSSVSNSGSMNNQPNKNMMNNINVSIMNNVPPNDAEISPSVKNHIVENLENLTIERNSNVDDLDEDEPRPRLNAAPMTMNNQVNNNNNTDLSSFLPNKTIVEVEEIKQPQPQPQAASTTVEDESNGNGYYDQGLLDDDDDDDDYFSESDSELIRNTRFNANMVGDEFYYDKSFDSPIQRPPPDPNRKTVQFNDDVKRISHVEYVSDDEKEYFSDEGPKNERPPPPQHRNNNARREHRLTGSHGLRGPPPPRDHDRDRDRDRERDRDRDRDHRMRMSERRSSRHGPPAPMRQNINRVLNNQKQTVNNRVTLPPPQMGEITVTNSMPGIEDYELEELENDTSPTGNKNPPPSNPPPPVPFDKNALKNLDNLRTSTPPPANFGKLSANKARHHMSQPPPASGNNSNAPPLRVRPKVRHVQIQTRRINSHNVAVQTTSYVEDINTIFKGDVEKSTNVEVLQNEIVNYREIIKRMNDELRDIKRENQQLTSDYRQMRHEREKMIETNKRKEIEFDDLSSRAHKKLKELIEDRQQLLSEKERLQSENEQMESIIDKLKKQIESIDA
jgi:hypothetical protein